MVNRQTPSPISPDLLEILRDPQAIQEGDRYGADPGRLELVRGCWLVSADTGYKYPIRDGIPVMLIEEGARWKDTPVAALPVPPPPAIDAPAPETRADEVATMPAANETNIALLVAIGALVLALLIVIGLSRRHAASPEPLPEPLVP
ncbi:MAG TPA: hypothetical protein PK829_02600 [Promineifilum sp.]|nr:hypothetical protein [Promineifilum sp.]